MNPQKLVEFSEQKMIPEAAKKYMHRVVDEEMPRGLKQYMELVLFPRIHLKVKKGISIHAARRFLHKEGFRYMEYRKGLYFDGHERPDEVWDRQDRFLPEMQRYQERLVEYMPHNEDIEKTKAPKNYVER